MHLSAAGGQGAGAGGSGMPGGSCFAEVCEERLFAKGGRGMAYFAVTVVFWLYTRGK